MSAGPSRVLLLLAAGLAALCGACLALPVIVALRGFAAPDDAIFWTLALAAAAMVPACFGAALTGIGDALRRAPVLVLDSGGLRDRRLLAGTLPWCAVAGATIRFARGGNIAGVRLKLRRDAQARHNPLRFGALGFAWRRRRDELHIPLMLMSPDPHTLAHAIAGLVRRHGGVAEEEPRGLERALRLLAYRPR